VTPGATGERPAEPGAAPKEPGATHGEPGATGAEPRASGEPGASAAPRIVVGAMLVRGGRLLAARRTAPAETAGMWEFPGVH
jgi:hypothetical protein